MSSIRTTESTPPLYYYLAWGWERIFGSGETGMRLLPALLGTLLVPATWAAARVTLPARSALIAAALVALSPLLVWYSQEARPYALFVLLATLGFLFFVRILRRAPGVPASRDLVLWSLLSLAAVLTHYFAVFAVGAQALWLFFERTDIRGRVAAAALPPALVGVALLPLLREQEENVPRAWTRASRSLTSCAAAFRSWRWGCAGLGSCSVPASSPSSASARRRWCCWSGAERGPSGRAPCRPVWSPWWCWGGRCWPRWWAPTWSPPAMRSRPGRWRRSWPGGARGDRSPPDRSRPGRGALRGVAGHRRGRASRRTPAA